MNILESISNAIKVKATKFNKDMNDDKLHSNKPVVGPTKHALIGASAAAAGQAPRMIRAAANRDSLSSKAFGSMAPIIAGDAIRKSALGGAAVGGSAYLINKAMDKYKARKNKGK